MFGTPERAAPLQSRTSAAALSNATVLPLENGCPLRPACSVSPVAPGLFCSPSDAGEDAAVAAAAARAQRVAGIQVRLQLQRQLAAERKYSRHLGRVIMVVRRVHVEFLETTAEGGDVGALRCCCSDMAKALRPGLSAWSVLMRAPLGCRLAWGPNWSRPVVRKANAALTCADACTDVDSFPRCCR